MMFQIYPRNIILSIYEVELNHLKGFRINKRIELIELRKVITLNCE